MNRLKKFLVNYSFIVVPAVYLLATVFMDIAMYLFMGLRFPSRYYFSLIVLFAICGLMFFIKKSSVQYGICIFLLAVHFAVGVANIILYDQAREIVSLESLTAARQVATLTDFIILDFGYMLTFSLILLTFICLGIWMFSVIGRNRKRFSDHRIKPYRRNVVLAVATLSITAYLTGAVYNFTLPKVTLDAAQAYNNYTNDRFVYSTFTNRLRVLQEFGTYSYYWSNISFALGLKQEFEYDIPNRVVDTFTFPELPTDKQNIIMLQMETLERNLIHPLVMPNLYNFLYNDGTCEDIETDAYMVDKNSGLTTAHNTVEFQGLYAVDRTSIAEYKALAGVHLDGVEMNAMPTITSPFALPHVLASTRHKNNPAAHYTSIKAFHNYYSYMYNRDRFYTDGLGFDEYISLMSTPSQKNDMVNDEAVYGPAPSRPENETRHYSDFNKNSDYKMFKSQVNNMAPVNEKFFSFIINISTHMPYDTELFKFYEESGKNLFGEDYKSGNIETLRQEYENLNARYPQRTQDAVKSFLTGAYEYDRGLGVLFDHLEANDLLDKTTIIFYGDHYNNTAADLLAPTASAKSDINPVTGGGQGKMLGFYIYSPAFTNASETPEIIIKNGIEDTAETVDELTRENQYFGKNLGNPNTSEGVVKKFLTTYDVYATVCDLLHIKINTRFTLGISAFSGQTNIGFSVKTGIIFNDKWATYSLASFTPGLSTGYMSPNLSQEINAAKAQLSHQLAVMNNLRPLFRSDNLRHIEETFYYITSSS